MFFQSLATALTAKVRTGWPYRWFWTFFNGLKAQARFDRPEYSMNECNLYRGERNGQLNFFSPYFFSMFFSLLTNFFGRFSLINLLRGLLYLLLHRSASFPRVLKEDKHTKHVCHVVLVYTHSVILVIQTMWLASYLGLWRYIQRARRKLHQSMLGYMQNPPLRWI